MSVVSYPPVPSTRTDTTTVVNGATVVTLAFDAEGVLATATGPVAVTDARIEGVGTVVLDVVTPAAGLRAAVIGSDATVRVEAGRLVYRHTGPLPQAGGATILLTPRTSTKRADNTLSPAPPDGLVYTERVGQTGALEMTCDARTQAVRIEALDPKPRTLTKPVWLPLRTDAAAPGPVTVALTIADDVPGRRFRAVALRTVAGDEIESSPSAESYRNRAPVSRGAMVALLPVGGKAARVSLLGLVSDPDGGEMTFRAVSRHDTFGRETAPSWLYIDGTDLVVETAAPRGEVTFAVVGVDERGTSASADVTVSVYVPDGPGQPGRFEYAPFP